MTTPLDLSVLPAICKDWRRSALRMIHAAKSGHPGGALSIIELVAGVYLRHLRFDASNPGWADRDRFILSKGHGVPTLYCALAETGFIPRDELMTLRRIDGRLEGHPDRCRCPGIEASTGSLGQGLSIGIGHALAARLDQKAYHTYVLVGDGEIQEGQVWEAALFAAQHGLSNLTCIVDVNGFQLDDSTANIIGVEPLGAKWESFGWSVEEIDGHDLAAVDRALGSARDAARRGKGRPTVIVARTVKGKGVSFMENNNEWHGVAPDDAQLAAALKELA